MSYRDAKTVSNGTAIHRKRLTPKSWASISRRGGAWLDAQGFGPTTVANLDGEIWGYLEGTGTIAADEAGELS